MRSSKRINHLSRINSLHARRSIICHCDILFSTVVPARILCMEIMKNDSVAAAAAAAPPNFRTSYWISTFSGVRTPPAGRERRRENWCFLLTWPRHGRSAFLYTRDRITNKKNATVIVFYLCFPSVRVRTRAYNTCAERSSAFVEKWLDRVVFTIAAQVRR